MITQEALITFLTGFAYEPLWVYAFIVGLLTASSFGLPIPEEVTLISAGALGYVASNPVDFPPPYEGASAVNPITLAIVCFAAVFLSDLLIYFLGRFGRKRIESHRRLGRILEHSKFKKIEALTLKHGALMAGVFRFTPGLRFPGHLACGMMGVPLTKFCAVDGLAALLTVPTQVILVSMYGQYIVSHFKQFKILLLCMLVSGLIIYLVRKFSTRWSKLGAG